MNKKIQPNRPSYIRVTPPCAFLDFEGMCFFQRSNGNHIYEFFKAYKYSRDELRIFRKKFKYLGDLITIEINLF
ncbi:hypothetical protein BpHYR1_034999 [Brachionus plicatilis]|uniref:Uncharacterized protein n=1 Tax=Brachionus plicatilis TaxID=10195 RepID=A0A3M7R9D2_BRAPC|nr:hypothetical protein BpHYR1_034999 [Brachionus plicatilis]